MASTFSDLLRLEKQADGENENTWGQTLNAQIELLEDAIAGRASITLAASNVTLTTSNGATDQARECILDLNGTITANIEIIVPASAKFYIVNNGTTQTVAETVTVKTSAGTGIVIPDGDAYLVWCDGTNVEVLAAPAGGTVDADTLGGVVAASYARLDVKNLFVGSQVVTPVGPAADLTLTPDLDVSNVFIHGPLAAATAIANPTNTTGKNGQTFIIKVENHASTPFAVTFGSKYRFNGTAPTGTASAAANDIYSCMYDETLDLVFCTYQLNVDTAV